MRNYYVKRIVTTLITLLIISFLIFSLVRVIPGNPFPSEKMTPQQIENKRQELGLNDPLIVQYGRYMANLVQGDLGVGTSLYQGAPIKTVLKSCVANSFKIGGLAVLFGVIPGIVAGMFAALYKNKLWDKICTGLSIIGFCLPSYVFLIYIQKIFAFNLGIFPPFFDESKFLSSAIMPALCMGIFSFATVLRFTRNEMVEVLSSDYIKLVESKGIYGPRLIFRHALRNSLVPLITVIGPIIIDLLTGAAVIETICGINGMGRVMVEAISGEGVDYNYILILSIIYSGLYVIMMFILDILYGIIDPRISVASKKPKKLKIKEAK